MMEEQVDVENISLHGCIRNTSSDAEDLTKEKALALATMDIGGKNMQEQGQIRV